MTPAELQQYRDLCRRWPECDNVNLHFEDAHKPSQMVRNWQNFHRLGDWEIDAAVIHHLETAVLDKLSPGWHYKSPSKPTHGHVYANLTLNSRTRHVVGDARLPALLAACEAVLTAKGKSDA